MAMKPKSVLLLAALAAAMLAAAAASLAAAAPQPQETKPVATIKIVPVAANAADPNVIVTTMPNEAKTVARVGTTGLPNVPINVPVTLLGAAADPTTSVTGYAWNLGTPSDSQAHLSGTDGATVKFTPDVSGI